MDPDEIQNEVLTQQKIKKLTRPKAEAAYRKALAQGMTTSQAEDVYLMVERLEFNKLMTSEEEE